MTCLLQRASNAARKHCGPSASHAPTSVLPVPGCAMTGCRPRLQPCKASTKSALPSSGHANGRQRTCRAPFEARSPTVDHSEAAIQQLRSRGVHESSTVKREPLSLLLCVSMVRSMRSGLACGSPRARNPSVDHCALDDGRGDCPGINTVQECIVIVWGQQWRVGNGMHQEGSTW